MRLTIHASGWALDILSTAGLGRATLCALAVVICVTGAPVMARDLPHYATLSEDVSEQRRAVYVRIDSRIDEDDLLRIAQQIRAAEKRSFARTYVNFNLPGMPVNQGAWASVLFAPEPKVLVHGLSRTDEALFLAEHAADKRPQLGSWLTSPPAAPGRLTIYSEHGKIFAEWRLRNGQKTVDELSETGSRTVRRFEVPGGGAYQLTRAGDLEIWDRTTLVATAERIRPELASSQLVAQSSSKPMVSASAAAPHSVSAPAYPVAVQAAADAARGPAVAAVQAAHAPAALAAGEPVAEANVAAAAVVEPVELKKAKKLAKAKGRQSVAHLRSQDGLTTGDTIAAKIANRF